MTIKALILLLLSTIVIGCGGGGGGGDESSDSGAACGLIGLNAKIINGTTCGSIERSAVIRIVGDFGGVVSPLCTGTMISATQVLSAAHCFVDVNALRFGIAAGADDATTITWADRVYYPAGYPGSGNRAVLDVAVMDLSRGPGLPALPMLVSSAWPSGGDAFVFGYGQTKIGESEDVPFDAVDFSDLESGVMRIENVTANHYFVSFDGKGQNVCFGDSGGPLVVSTALGTTIIGVVSQGSTRDCSSGDVTTYTNLSDPVVRAFLAAVAGGAPTL